MPTFAVYNSHWDWRAWLDAHLNRLVAQQAPALVIDLRGNEGGDEVGREILARLIPTDTIPSALQRLTRY